MPILQLEIVDPKESELSSAQALADATAQVLGTGIGQTWVKVRALPKEQYAENGGESGLRPIFVSVLLKESEAEAQRAILAQRLAETIARVLQRPPENVHILFEPGAIGRIAFGGRLLKS